MSKIFCCHFIKIKNKLEEAVSLWIICNETAKALNLPVLNVFTIHFLSKDVWAMGWNKFERHCAEQHCSGGCSFQGLCWSSTAAQVSDVHTHNSSTQITIVVVTGKRPTSPCDQEGTQKQHTLNKIPLFSTTEKQNMSRILGWTT